MSKPVRVDPNKIITSNAALPGNHISAYSPSQEDNSMSARNWRGLDRALSWVLPGYNSAKKFAEGARDRDIIKAVLGLGGAAYSIGTLFAPQLKAGNLLKAAFPTATKALNRLGGTVADTIGEKAHQLYNLSSLAKYTPSFDLTQIMNDLSSPGQYRIKPPTDYTLNPFVPKGHDYFSPQNFGRHVSDSGLSPFSPVHLQDVMTKGKLHFKNDGGWASALPTGEAFIASLTKNAPRKLPQIYDYHGMNQVRKKLNFNHDPFANLPNKGKNPM